jgi:hypothetical protein
MRVELVCSRCAHRFVASADTPEEIIVQRMTEEGSWYALGAGKCFLDMIHTALIRRGRIICPECGGAVWVQTAEIIDTEGDLRFAFVQPTGPEDLEAQHSSRA